MEPMREQMAALAAELSGNIQAEAPEEQPQEPETPELETDEVEEPEAEVTESEDTPEVGVDDDVAVDTSTDENQLPSSVGELAEAIGWEASDIYDLKIPMGGDGHTISIGEFKDRVEGLDTATAQLEQQRGELVEREASINQQMATLPEELLNARAQALALGIQFEGINWAEFEQTDPGKAALLKQDFASKYQAAKAQEAQAMTQVDARVATAKQQTLEEQGQVLLDRVPEWKDSTLRDKEQQAIVEWGASEGLSRDGLLTLTDASVVSFLRKMWIRSQTVEKSDVEVKRVRKAPKMLKPGATQKRTPSSSKKAAQIIEKSRQPGLKQKDRDDLAIALMRNAGVK